MKIEESCLIEQNHSTSHEEKNGENGKVN